MDLRVAGAVRELTGDEILEFGWWGAGRIHQLNMGGFRRRAGAVEDRRRLWLDQGGAARLGQGGGRRRFGYRRQQV
jgi:hypothetical protein